MKNLMNVCLFGAVAIASAVPAAAQTKLEANVPFSFELKNKHLEAGNYTVTRIGTSPMYRIDGAGTTIAASVVTYPKMDPFSNEQPYMKFRCADGQCRLAEIATADSVVKFDTTKLRHERMQVVLLSRVAK